MAIDEGLRRERERELAALSDEELRERADRLGIEQRDRPRDDVTRDIAGHPEAWAPGATEPAAAPVATETESESETRTDSPTTAAAPAATAAEAAPPERRRRAVRLPPFAPFAPVGGWLTAWGAAALAAACLISAEVDLGLGLGIGGASAGELDASSVFDSANFWPSVWLLIVQAGAFALGGYAAARLARNRGTTHAALAWFLAMAASGADAIIAYARDEPQVIQALTLPTWVNNGLEAEVGTAIALAIFALVSLVAALIGGALGQSANRAAVIHVGDSTTT